MPLPSSTEKSVPPTGSAGCCASWGGQARGAVVDSLSDSRELAWSRYIVQSVGSGPRRLAAALVLVIDSTSAIDSLS